MDSLYQENHEKNEEKLGDSIIDTSKEAWEETVKGVRKLGMLDDDRFKEALDDERTINIELSDGRKVTSLVPMDYGDAAGYDRRRCVVDIAHADSEDVWAYMNSGEILSNATDESYQQVVQKLRDAGEGYIFYTVSEYDNPENNAETELSVLLQDAGMSTEWMTIKNEEAAKQGEDHAEASLSLFCVDVPLEAKTDTVASIDLLYDTYKKGVENGIYPNDTENGVAVMRGSDISEELADKLWDIYEDRFEWLGVDHPISMEDTKQSALPMITSGNTLLSIRFKDGEPVCFTDFVGNTDEVTWLNPEFLHDDGLMKRAENQSIVFFPGIVSAEAGAGYSMDVIGVLADIGLDSGASYKVVFENTNMSEIYIPKIVQDVINSRGREQVEAPGLVDKTYYKYLHYKQSE